MSDPLRFLPESWTTVHLVARTLQGRHLLKPSPRVNQIIVGVLARAQQSHAVVVHELAVLSNHYHLLISVRDADQQAGFMNFVQSNLARKVGAEHGWSGKFWHRRYKPIPVSREKAAQLERLKYLLAQGCKEGLVEDPRQWPGLHSAKIKSRETGTDGVHRIEGIWLDETSWKKARRRGETVRRQDFESKMTLELVPLPCFEETAPGEQGETIRELIELVREEAQAERMATGQPVLGVRAVLEGHPHHKSPAPERRRSPLIHAASRKVREEFRQAYREFVTAYRQASEALKTGCRDVEFPAGSFPPRLPFVPLAPRRAEAC